MRSRKTNRNPMSPEKLNNTLLGIIVSLLLLGFTTLGVQINGKVSKDVFSIYCESTKQQLIDIKEGIDELRGPGGEKVATGGRTGEEGPDG